LAFRQDEEAAVVDDQRDPLTVQFGHITQRLAGRNAVVQTVLLLEETIKLRPFVLTEPADTDTTQDLGFIRNEGESPAPRFSKRY
jgi:hypothetical protein